MITNKRKPSREFREDKVVHKIYLQTKQNQQLHLTLREKFPNTEFSGPYFSLFGLNTEIYGVSLGTQSKKGKMRSRKTPYLDNFHAK